MNTSLKRLPVVIVILIACGVLHCRTFNGSTEPPATTVKDFDTAADTSVTYDVKFPYTFCGNSKHFSVVNAYWLGVASNFVYANRATIGSVMATIRESWKADVSFIANDPSGSLDYDSQAMWIEVEDLAILAFRGTQTTAQDFVTDFELLSTPFDATLPQWGAVHSGFKGGKNVIWDKIKPKLASLKQSKKKLFITGHSLGGALATIAAARIMALPEFRDSARPYLRGLYTFGSPRVGDGKFAEAFANEKLSMPNLTVVRMRNAADVVTRVPSSRLTVGYQHVGELFYLAPTGRLYSSTTNVKLRRLFMPNDVSSTMIENIADYVGRTFLKKYSDHSMLQYLDKIATEYRFLDQWSTEKQRNTCDMGLYEIPWHQDAKPADVKPWTNDAPIATAQTNEGTTTKDCCWCTRTWYGSSWARDKVIKLENQIGVIQEGEIASGSCMYPGGKPMGFYWWQDDKYIDPTGAAYRQYYTYDNCERATVVGSACVLEAELWIDRRRSGRYIRKESWAP